jgi:ATP-dependent RNA helicase RhlE
LDQPVEVAAARSATTVEGVKQSVYYVEKQNKVALLVHLLSQVEVTRVLVFTRTKHGADAVVRNLTRARVAAEAIHGNKSQSQRERILQAFKRGKVRVLVATDIASRGLDIDHVSHVVNFDVPHDAESYVHRIGRTGRAGSSGIALSFCAVDERSDLTAIERLIRRPLDVVTDHPFCSPLPVVKTPHRVFSSSRRGSHRRPLGRNRFAAR